MRVDEGRKSRGHLVADRIILIVRDADEILTCAGVEIMCVAVPMKLVELEGTSGKAEMEGVSITVNTMLVPEAKVGDYLIIHAGFAIQLLDVEEAERNLALFREIAELSEKEEAE